MKQLTPEIDLDVELKALADYIRLKWTPIEGLEEVFRAIRHSATLAARAWLDQHALWQTATELFDERLARLQASLPTQEERDSVRYYDAACHFLYEVEHLSRPLQEAGRDIDGKWDYSRRVDSVANRLAAKYPGLAAVRPLGWDELEKGYCDFDGMEEYDARPDRNLFQGTHVDSACAPNFVGRTALPYVMYDEKCQGRRAYRVLVGAVYAQFLGIREYLNTHLACSALRELVAQAPQHLLFEYKPVTSNPLLQVVASAARPAPGQAEYEESLALKRGFQALSEEEKQIRRLSAEEESNRLISEILAATKRSDSQEDPQKVRIADLMASMFSA